MPSGPTLVTPNRRTRLLIDVVDSQVVRPTWKQSRFGPQISKARSNKNTTANVALQPGGAWTLAPHSEDLSRIIHTDLSTTVLGTADVNLGTSWGAVDTFKKPTDLTGIGASGSLISSGVPAFTKRVAAGADWSSELSGDTAAFPKPDLGTTDYPMDRVLVSKGTYAPDAGFVLAFRLPPEFVGIDQLLSFYFGGPADGVTPRGVVAGQFCLTVKGNGQSTLWEYDASTSSWFKRMDWVAFHPNFQGNFATVTIKIWPHGQDRIAFSAVGMDGVAGGGSGATLGGLLVTIAGMYLGAKGAHRQSTCYLIDSPLTAGYIPGPYITGPGQVRLDVRRDIRTLIMLAHLKPPATGSLIDLPLWVPFPIPADTHLTLRVYGYAPSDSTVQGTVYDATTGNALTSLGSGVFKSNAGQQAYFVGFDFAASSDGQQTPVMLGYELEVADNAGTRSPTALSSPVRSVSITGPDFQPDHDSAHVKIEDVTNALSLLRVRGAFRSKIAVYTDAGVLTSVLFEGEMVKATGRLKGKVGKVYPSPSWREYEIDLAGMWARLARQLTFSRDNFSVDWDAGFDATGKRPPWKITDIIRYLLNRAGFIDAQIDVADINLRLWPSAGGSTNQDWLLQTGSSIADFLQHLCRDYLASALVWDPNAGISGMWRLITNPRAPYNVLATFVTKPTGAGKLPAHPNSYPAGYTFIRDQTYRDFVKPPECNYVLVTGMGGQLPGEGGPTQVVSQIYNSNSFDFVGATSNPAHPDYLGFFCPVIYCDPTLASQRACDFAARRIFEVSAHAQYWAEFQAPLILVTDTLDPYQVRVRPLRINDAVSITGTTAIVRSVNIAYDADGVQMADYECLVVG